MLHRLLVLFLLPGAIWAGGSLSCLVAPPAPEVFPASVCGLQPLGPLDFAGHTVVLQTFGPPISVSGTSSLSTDASNAATFCCINSFFDVFTEVSLDAGSFTPVEGPVQISMAGTNQPGVFNTQLSELNLNIGGGVLLRVDPSTPSLGATSITAQCCGEYRITSFFDVFTDISLDGGGTWTPATNGPTTFALVNDNVGGVPEPSTGWLWLLSCVALGAMRLRRRAD